MTKNYNIFYLTRRLKFPDNFDGSPFFLLFYPMTSQECAIFSFMCFREIVELLLTNEASTNIVDTKGSSPLHLAAWTGNVDIVRVLLCHGPSVPNVNLMVCTFLFFFV